LWSAGERQLKAVAEANEISQENLLAEHRAWLSVKATIQSHFRIYSISGIDDDDAGAGSFEIGLEIQNIGKTRAFNVRADAEIIFDHPFTAPRALKSICSKNRGVVFDWASLVLAGVGCGDQLEMEMDFYQSELEHFGGCGFVSPITVGCVTYQILPDKSFHQTGFIYLLTGSGGHTFDLPINGSTLQGALLLSPTPGWTSD
jgi:hypothetical protein